MGDLGPACRIKIAEQAEGCCIYIHGCDALVCGGKGVVDVTSPTVESADALGTSPSPLNVALPIHNTASSDRAELDDQQQSA